MSTLLRVDNLIKRFGGVLATDKACLDVVQGEIHALIGPNGAGKTTLIHQLSGALVPTAGDIFFRGENVTRSSIHKRARQGLVRSYQITSIFKPLSVHQNLTIAIQGRTHETFGMWRRASFVQRRLEEAEQLAIRVGLGDKLGQCAALLSHGEQRQLEVGLALAMRPEMLLLDEPMAGMGHEESGQLVDLLIGLKGSVTILLVEHDMDAVFKVADRISTLVFGRVIATGSPDEIRRHPEVRKAYLGDEFNEVAA